MTREELMQRLALHVKDIAEGTTRALVALDQVESALIDTLEAQKAATRYFRSKSPHDANGFERASFRTEAVQEILRTLRVSLLEKSQDDLDRHYGVGVDD